MQHDAPKAQKRHVVQSVEKFAVNAPLELLPLAHL